MRGQERRLRVNTHVLCMDSGRKGKSVSSIVLNTKFVICSDPSGQDSECLQGERAAAGTVDGKKLWEWRSAVRTEQFM